MPVGANDPAVLEGRATAAWGGAARPATAADAIDDVRPAVVLEPPDVATLSAMLGWADREGVAVVPRGAGSRLRRGSRLVRLEAILSLGRLSQPLEHCAGDLTVTVPAGATLGAINRVLATAGQRLALDPPFASRRTIGGIVATNDSGPWRHAYGTPRDLIIGIELAMADGRVAKAGGRVVKNVAGYDLARMLCGSYGSLAVITGATFKLAPIPQASRTLLATGPGPGGLADMARTLTESPIAPSAVRVVAPSGCLLVRVESTAAAANRQVDLAAAVCRRAGLSTEIATGEAELALWNEQTGRIWEGDRTVLKVAVLPTELPALLEKIGALAATDEVTWRAEADGALGVAYVALEGGLPAQVALTSALRHAAEARGGSLVVLAASAAFKADVDPWGAIGSGLKVMRAVKDRFDPNRTLSAGNGPGGL